jgi:WD40 repeat protein
MYSDWLATGSGDGEIKFWKYEEKRELQSWKAHDGQVFSLRMAPGNHLASCGSDGQVRLWNQQHLVYSLPGHTNQAFGVTTSEQANLIVSGGADRMVRIWDFANNKALKPLPVGDEVYSVDISPDGRLIAAASRNGRVYLFRVNKTADPVIPTPSQKSDFTMGNLSIP